MNGCYKVPFEQAINIILTRSLSTASVRSNFLKLVATDVPAYIFTLRVHMCQVAVYRSFSAFYPFTEDRLLFDVSITYFSTAQNISLKFQALKRYVQKQFIYKYQLNRVILFYISYSSEHINTSVTILKTYKST